MRTIARNTAFVTIGGLALKTVSFLFGVFVVRRLGDERFGQYSIVLAFVGLFQIFAELGISQYVMREIARDRSKAGQLFWDLVAVRLVLAAIGIATITLAATGVGYSPGIVMGVFLYTWTFVLSAFTAPLETLLTAHERFDVVAPLTVLGQVSFVALGSLVLLLGWGFIALVGIGIVAMLPQLVVAALVVRRNGYIVSPPRVSPRSWPALVRSGLPFMFISLSLTVTFRFDTVVLSKLVSEQAVGWYNAAYGLVKSLTFALSGFSVAMVPSLARTYVQDSRQVEVWYRHSVRIIALLGVPVAVGGMLIAEPLIEALYTSEFLPAAAVFKIIVWDVPLLLFAGFCGNMTTVVGEERAAARIYATSAAANVVLNLLLIPVLGIIGAAIVTVVTDLVAAVPFFVLLSRKLGLTGMSWLLGRVVIANLLMAVVVLLLIDVNLVVAIAGSAAAYAVFLALLRVVSRNELGQLRSLVRPSG